MGRGLSMQCKSCQQEVLSKFTHAIMTNICPFCGSEIMDPDLQKVLNSLKDVMNEGKSKKYLYQIFDWLHSNYELVNKNDEQYQVLLDDNFSLREENKNLKEEIENLKNNKNLPNKQQTPKPISVENVKMGVDKEGNNVQMEGELLSTNEVFKKRALVKSDNNKIKQLAEQIKKNGSISPSEDPIDIETSSNNISENEMEEILSNSLQTSSMINNALPSSYEDDDFDSLPPEVESFVNQAASSKDGGYNAKDVEMLKKIQNKNRNASAALDRGGSVGLIKR